MLDESTIKRDILKQIMKAMDGSVGEKVSSHLKPKEDVRKRFNFRTSLAASRRQSCWKKCWRTPRETRVVGVF